MHAMHVSTNVTKNYHLSKDIGVLMINAIVIMYPRSRTLVIS